MMVNLKNKKTKTQKKHTQTKIHTKQTHTKQTHTKTKKRAKTHTILNTHNKVDINTNKIHNNILKTIDVLIIGSSDMDGKKDNFNYVKNVLNIPFPCNLFKRGEDKQKCKNCNYTKIEHKYKYPIFPLDPVKYKIYVNNKEIIINSEYSEFWKNKYPIYERLKLIYGENININYHTLTPNYITNTKYLPTINKINTIIKDELNIKGSINYKKPYHFSCLLADIYKQKKYNNTKYDSIFVVGAGLGWLYSPNNFKVMTKLLKDNDNIPKVIGNLWYKSLLTQKIDFIEQMVFMNPIKQCTDPILINKKCIKDYSNILINNNNFIEMWDMLFKK